MGEAARTIVALGMMSGTSGDGIDAALIELAGVPEQPRVTLHAHRPFPFPDATRDAVLAASGGASLTAAELAILHRDLGDLYADAALAIMGAAARRPDVVGLHGQTVAHLPTRRVTLQIGDAARVAARTGATTVSDFRSADVAAGGEGAPLTPFADHVLFSSRAPCVVLNLGGIANATLLPSADPADVRGFDTGPANMLLDALARTAGRRYDEDGSGALRGRVVPSALERALGHPFFSRGAPKSAGREEFGNAFAAALHDDVRAAGGGLDDALATATELTARTVAAALAAEGGGHRWRDVIVAGGGALNVALLAALRRALDPVPVRRIEDLGIPAEGREAIAFAILAAYRLRGLPNTLPACTGAARAVSAGVVHAP